MKLRFLSAGVALLLAGLVGHARAQVVNFNFMEDYNSTNVNFGLGATPDNPANTYWNRVGESSGSHPQDAATMFASDGTTMTGIRFAFDHDSFGTGGSHLAADDLFRGYFYSWGAAAPFTFTGLTAGKTYDFYFYSETGTFGQDWAADFTLNGHTQHLTAVQQTSFIVGENYVMFELTPGGTSLTGSFQTTGSAGVAVLSGVSVAAVPEPSTYAAIFGAVVLGGVISVRRRAVKVQAS